MLFSYRSVTSVVTQSSLRRGCLRDDPRDGTLAPSVYLNDLSLYHHLFPTREPLLSWLLVAFCKDEKWQTLMVFLCFAGKNTLCVDKRDKTTTRHVAKTYFENLTIRCWRFDLTFLRHELFYHVCHRILFLLKMKWSTKKSVHDFFVCFVSELRLLFWNRSVLLVETTQRRWTMTNEHKLKVCHVNLA